MDDDAELIAKLTARAGMIMEDVSVRAITMVSQARAERGAALATLSDAAQTIELLIAAATALDRHAGQNGAA